MIHNFDPTSEYEISRSQKEAQVAASLSDIYDRNWKEVNEKILFDDS